VKALLPNCNQKDGVKHGFYGQFNFTTTKNDILVTYFDYIALACGAIKQYGNKIMEVKQMYLKPNARGNGIASIVLKDSESYAMELNYKKCILVIGVN